MKKTLPLVFLIVAAAGCKERTSGAVPFLGLDSHGKIIHHYISSFASKKMSSTLSKSSDEIIDGLEEITFQHENPWTLSRITVGLGLEAGLDVLEVVKLESEGGIELRFEPIANN